MPLAWWVGRRVRTGSFIQAAASGRVLAARAGGEKTCFSRRGQDDHRRSGRAGTQSGELGKMPNRFSGFRTPGRGNSTSHSRPLFLVRPENDWLTIVEPQRRLLGRLLDTTP